MTDLRSLVKAAGFVSTRRDPHSRAIVFMGRTREWTFIARRDENWFNLFTFICAVPHEPGVRMRLFEAVLAANLTLALAKFSVAHGNLVLEVDYRSDHVDAAQLSNLVGLLLTVAEEYYPRLFRIVTGDDVLAALAPAIDLPPAPPAPADESDAPAEDDA